VGSTKLDPVDAFVALAGGAQTSDRDVVLDCLREERPVFYAEMFEAWVLTRHEDILTVLSDEETFETLSEGRGAPIYGRSLIQWRGREHNKKAGPVVKRIRSPRAFSTGVDEMVQRIAVEVADRLPFGVEIDFRQDYAMWIPLISITELLDIDESRQLSDWGHAIADGSTSSVAYPERRVAALDALAQLRELLEPIVAERRQTPGSDIVSDLATATYDGEPFPFDEIVATVAFLITAGGETTERALTSLFRHLALHPDMWREVRARREDRTFLLSLSAEALRLWGPIQGLTRGTIRPTSFYGQTIDADERLVLMLGAANRDPRAFDAPERFDPERWIDNAERQFVAGGRVLPFGAGRHHCAGSRLAATEMVHAIREFCARVDHLEPVGELPGMEGLLLTSPPSLPVICHPA
jgi:pulcherriminic acid synthase